MLHSFVPHDHHNELSEVDHIIEYESADSWLDFARLVFHQDMGDGHLEHYQAENGNLVLEMAYVSHDFNVIHSGLLLIEAKLIVSNYNPPFLISDSHELGITKPDGISLRGPPQFS